MKNLDIKDLARKNGVYLWEIADKLNFTDTYFSRILRTELPNEKKVEIVNIIKELSEKKRKELDEIINQLSE